MLPMHIYDRKAAYKAVIDRIKQTAELPPNRAPQSWLAEQLGVARQLVYWWEERGFPEVHAAKIAELLGMDPMEVCPHAPIYLPEDVFQGIVACTTDKKSFQVRMIELIQAGIEQRTTPWRRKTNPKSKSRSK